MEFLDYLRNNPVLLTAHFIAFVILLIVAVFLFVMLLKGKKERILSHTALEIRKIANSVRAGFVHFILEDNCRILYASRGFYELLGYTKQEAKDASKNSLIDFVNPGDFEMFYDQQGVFSIDSINCETRMITKSGETVFVLINGNSTLGKDKKHTISAVFVDISQQKKMQEAILLQGEKYRIATELSKDIIFEYHIAKDEMIHTGKFKQLFGQNAEISNFCTSCDLRRDTIHPDDWGIYLEFCQELSQGKNKIETEFRVKDRLGEYIWCQAMGKTIYDDYKQPIRIIGKIINIDTYKRELEALEYKATRDPLTGVYNKEVTIKKIDKYIRGNKNNKHILMLIDFDDFKSVNDVYGHLLGDKVLCFVIKRIKELFSEGEIIGRIGGDEFVIFSGNVVNEEEIYSKARNLLKALDTTYMENGKAIRISGSIGIAMYPREGANYVQLMECADQALYCVKRHGKNNYMLFGEAI